MVVTAARYILVIPLTHQAKISGGGNLFSIPFPHILRFSVFVQVFPFDKAVTYEDGRHVLVHDGPDANERIVLLGLGNERSELAD